MENGARWIEKLASDREGLEALGRELGIHPLALEDCFHSNQRAKFDDFESHQLVVWFAFIAGQAYELEFVVFPRTVLLVSSEPPPDRATWREQLNLNLENLEQSDGFHLLFHALDRAMDLSGAHVRPLVDQLDEFEERLFREATDPIALLHLKRKIRRAVFALSFLPSVARQLQQFLHPKDDLRWKLRDLLDHCERTHQDLTFHESQIASAMDMYWGFTAKRTNDRIKKLTLVASVAFPLTFWSSFWGMNFETIPYRDPQFFYIALAIMAVSAGLMYFALRRRGYWEKE